VTALRRIAMADNPPTESKESAAPSPSTTHEVEGPAVRDRVIRLAFDGDRDRYDEFIRAIREAVPPDVSVVLRGSAVTGSRWEDGAPFDADGPGTSDLDLTLIGGDMVRHFEVFYIPRLHSAPLSDEHPDASVTFLPLRRALCNIARRPVNIQATADLVQFLRDRTMNQPYFTLIPKVKDADDEEQT
jgi:predicted nucleotidyltransferase